MQQRQKRNDMSMGRAEYMGNYDIERDYSIAVAELRKYLWLSRGSFAEPLGLSPSHIARFEKGESIPTEDTITSICEAFGVDPRYFAADSHIAVEEAVTFIDHSKLIPARLKAAREAKGWSQRELDKRSGVHVSIINRVEFGAKLTMKQGVKLAEALEVGIDWLMEGKEDRKNWSADEKLINWLWANEEVRRELRERMNGEERS